jgi:hypothetical protein
MEENKAIQHTEAEQVEASAETENTEKNQHEKFYTEEEVNKLISEKIQERLARVYKKYEGFNELKKEYEELKQFKEQVEMEKLTEQEKMQKQLEKIQQEKEKLLNDYKLLQETLKQERLNYKFRQLAQANNIQYVDAALKLADLSSVEVDEDGNFVNLEEVVKKLIEENPFLVSLPKEKPKPIGEPSNPKPEKTEKTVDQLIREAEERFRKSQSPRDYVNLVNLKRKYNRYNRL